MPITVATGITFTDSTDQDAYPVTAFTPVASSFLVVFVLATGTVAAGELTDNQGIGFERIASRSCGATSQHRIYCFVANRLAAAVSTTLTFSCVGDAATGVGVHVACLTGGEGVYIRQVTTAGDLVNGTPEADFPTAMLTGNCGLGFATNLANPAALTPPASWTETNGCDTGYAAPTVGIECCNRVSGETGTSITWGSASAAAWGVIVLEAYVAGSGPTMLPDAGGFFGVQGAP